MCLAFEEMSNDPETSSAAPSARDVLREMWDSRRGEAVTDLQTLLSDLESLADSPDETEFRLRAQARAHQLVGVFGVFGYADLKNLMAHVDIELSDSSIDVMSLVGKVRDILSSLP